MISRKDEKMKRIFRNLLAVIIAVSSLAVPLSAFAATGNQPEYRCVYAHDPRINSKAMADIVVNPDAVYGFSPDPDSTRLGEYASYDWTDPEVVEAARQDRIAYLADFNNQYELWDKMSREGKSTEEIARAVSTMRNENRLASYADNPEGLAKVKQSNLETYGNENGPTPESLFEKYGSWEKVILKSFSSNSGMDACLGLYDIQYEHNKLVQSVVENETIVYTVKKGDYLFKIADKYYGNTAAWEKIYDANRDKVGKDYIIQIDEQLLIP